MGGFGRDILEAEIQRDLVERRRQKHGVFSQDGQLSQKEEIH